MRVPYSWWGSTQTKTRATILGIRSKKDLSPSNPSRNVVFFQTAGSVWPSFSAQELLTLCDEDHDGLLSLEELTKHHAPPGLHWSLGADLCVKFPKRKPRGIGIVKLCHGPYQSRRMKLVISFFAVTINHGEAGTWSSCLTNFRRQTKLDRSLNQIENRR